MVTSTKHIFFSDEFAVCEYFLDIGRLQVIF